MTQRIIEYLRKNWILAVILALAVLLRLPLLRGSFWLDEAAQVLESSRPFAQQLNIRDDFQPPLMHYIVHFLLNFSHNEVWLRLGGAVIPGVISIAVTYMIGQRLASRRVGAIAAGLVATSSFHIFFSQELRPYALPMMWATLGWLIVVKLIFDRIANTKKKTRAPQPTKLNWRLWSVFVICSVLGWYSSYLYPFVWATQLLCVFVFGSNTRRWQNILAAAATILFFIPWLPHFQEQLTAGQLLRTALPGWEKVVSFSQIKSISLTFGKFIFGSVDIDPTLPFLLTSAALLIAASGLVFATIYHWQRLARSERTAAQKQQQAELLRKFSVLVLWAILPILGAWLISFAIPVLQPKRVIYCLPAFYLVIVFMADWVARSVTHRTDRTAVLTRLAVLSTILILIVTNVTTWVIYRTHPIYHREDWRTLHTQILNRYSPEESVVVFAFQAPFAPWAWYDYGRFPTLSTGYLVETPTTNLEKISTQATELLKQTSDFKYVLVFDYLRDLSDPHHLITDYLEQHGWVEVETLKPTTKIGFVHVYARPTSVLTQHFQGAP